MSLKGKIVGNINRRTKIYRIFPRHRFFELFFERKNTLVLPTKWDDPFENFILNAQVQTADGKNRKFHLHNKLYGQCWTLHKRSDAMWRIYSPNKDAIRIRTTVGGLIDSLYSANKSPERDRCFIGKVTYPTDAELKKFSQTVFKNGLNECSIAQTLLVKRNAFEHENEVRLIFIDADGVANKEGVYKYPFNPFSVFDQLVIDPRMSYKRYTNLKKEIIEKTGFDATRIKRSLLYKPPDDFVIKIP
ncbi:DUF2971 domain-containing protein [Kiloniella laminariae]|uniref:DUF2971 domain-containing protein n=1 Tax=Kiloniella laminariae TaxID=454162 RepID=UPI000373AEAB|nr:DUF2971 domain-containing protein [Kiloniella laminariae]